MIFFIFSSYIYFYFTKLMIDELAIYEKKINSLWFLMKNF